MESYVVPQVEIHQLFSEIPVALTQNQVPFIFGPNYLLHRFEDENERRDTYVGEYNSTKTGADDLKYVYRGIVDEAQIDDRYTKVFLDRAWVQLVKFTGEGAVARVKKSEGGKDNTLPDVLDVKTTVSNKDYYKELVEGRSLRLTCSDSKVRDVTVIKVDYDNSKISDTGSVMRIVIDEEIEDKVTISAADLCEIQNGIELPSKDKSDVENHSKMNWEIDNSVKNKHGVKLNAVLNVKAMDTDFYGEFHTVLTADVYVTTRELVTSVSDTIHSLVGSTTVSAMLGTVHPDNPLAQAVYNAALNAGGQTIRYMAVPTDNEEGYKAVLNAATLTKEVYFMVPATRDQKIIDLVKEHVNDMSAPTVKRWRISFVSKEIPDEDPIYTAESSTSGKDFIAKTLSYDETEKEAVVQFVVPSEETYVEDPDTRFKRDLRKNDILHTIFTTEWKENVYRKFRIVQVMTNNTIRVSDEDGILKKLITTPGKAEIYHPYTNDEKAEQIRNLSRSLADRGMYNIFPSVFTGSGVMQTGEFAAAAVAGLVSSCLPQQPVTNLELTGIDDIPLVYQTCSYYQRNAMASGGTFILMQDLPNDKVYVRHQISTDYSSNNLNTAELSITKNLDSISYFLDDLCSPYIGKYNITPELLPTIRSVIGSGLTRLSSNSYGLYGSQLIADGTEILLIEQDALLKDHVNCSLKLNMPYPFNHLVIKLFV